MTKTNFNHPPRSNQKSESIRFQRRKAPFVPLERQQFYYIIALFLDSTSFIENPRYLEQQLIITINVRPIKIGERRRYERLARSFPDEKPL